MSKTIAVILAGLILFSGCQKPLDLGDRSFIGATRIGDGLQVEINKNQIKMQLEDKMSGTAISGTLTPLANYEKSVFTLKEMPDLKIVLSPDDLIIYGTKKGYAKFGVGVTSYRNSYSKADIIGMYNFILQYHSENQDKFSFGTFELAADNTWRTWRFKDGFEKKYEPDFNGYWVDSGKGRIQAFLENNRLFAALALSERGDSLLVINLIEKNGLALGIKRNVLKPSNVNGHYSVLSSKGNRVKKATVRNEVVTQGKKKLELIYNHPWDGFFRDTRGEILGVFSPKGTCFGLNIGTITGSQFIFAGVKNDQETP